MSDGDDTPKPRGRPRGSGAPAFDWAAPRGTIVATVKCPACGRPVPMKPSEKGRLSGICPHAFEESLEPCNTKVFFGIPKSRHLTQAWAAQSPAKPARPAPEPKDTPPDDDTARNFLGRPL